MQKTFLKTISSIVLLVIFLFFLSLTSKLKAGTININTENHTETEIGHYGSGFILTLVPPDAPSNLITDLNIKFFRTQTPQIQQDYDRIKATSAQIQFLIYADYFGTNIPSEVWPGDNNDWSAWESAVTNAVNLKLENNYDVEYEIWNEPDYDLFWRRDQSRFFETWKRAVNIIKNMDPDAKIAGPSLAYYDLPFLKDFLTFARDNNVLPNTLMWHELNPDDGYKYISDRVNEINTWMSQNEISVDRIIINEIVKDVNMYSASHLLGFFTELEKNKIFGAHACWDDPQQGGQNTCFNNTLDGIVTLDHKPRSLWWLYKYYAQMNGKISYFDDNLVGFSTYDEESHKTQILVGQPNSNEELSINYNSDWLNNLPENYSKKITVSTYLLTDNAGNPVDEVATTVQELVYEDGIKVTLENINGDSVGYIVIQDDALENSSIQVVNDNITDILSENDNPVSLNSANVKSVSHKNIVLLVISEVSLLSVLGAFLLHNSGKDKSIIRWIKSHKFL